MFNLKNNLFLTINLLLVLNFTEVNGVSSFTEDGINDNTCVTLKLQNLSNKLHQFFEADIAILVMFDEMTRDWLEYHQKSQAFCIQTLVKAADLLISKEIERYLKGDETALPHVIRIAHILWTEGKVRSINVLASSLLDHINEVGVTDENLKEDHPPTQTEEEHRQAHLDIAPDQSINAQMIHLAHRIEHLRYRIDLHKMTAEEILIYAKWNQKLLEALHGANENLEKTLKAEMNRKFQNSAIADFSQF
jgi:hypothetical protein